MGGFTGFAAAFCCVCAVLGAVHLITPKGALSKSVGLVMSLVFISVLLSAALGAKRFSPDLSGYSVNEQSTDQMYETAMRQVFEQALRDGGINFSKIEVCTDKTENGSIFIIEVTVYSSDSEESIKELIGQDDEYEVKVINE